MITALVGIAEIDLTWHYVSNLIWWYVLFLSLPPFCPFLLNHI